MYHFAVRIFPVAGAKNSILLLRYSTYAEVKFSFFIFYV